MSVRAAANGSHPRQSTAPQDCLELVSRARSLEGVSLVELARALGDTGDLSTRRRKGRIGQLLERALGAVGGSAAGPDFADLGVELKTIPIDAEGRALESTFVCRVSLRAAESVDFEASHLRAKLSCVLWISILGHTTRPRVGRALLWRPTPTQESVLRADYDDVMGAIAIGHIEGIDARVGRWLQLRPKAAHGGVRTRAYNAEGGPLLTMPRGFYLRARFTSALLRDPETLAYA